MPWLRQLSWLGVGMIAMGFCLAVELVGIFERRALSQRAESKSTRERQELAALLKTNPAPTAENSLVAAEALARATQNVRAWEKELTPEGPQFVGWQKQNAPAKRTDAFFDLASFVETMRLRAAEKGVRLSPDERFGFSAYAHEGPDAALISTVFRQRKVTEYLLESLFEAQPIRLVGVARERPASRDPATKNKNSQETSPKDFFDMEMAATTRVPGKIIALAFRVIFIGQTEELRRFLDRLAKFELPLLVRSLEAEPATPAEAATNAARSAEFAPGDLPAVVDEKPVVLPVPLKFTVIVEFVERPGQPVAEAADSVKAPS